MEQLALGAGLLIVAVLALWLALPQDGVVRGFLRKDAVQAVHCPLASPRAGFLPSVRRRGCSLADRERKPKAPLPRDPVRFRAKFGTLPSPLQVISS